MACVHLVKLYQLCQQEGLKLGGADLIHIVCEQCGEKEVGPAVLMDEYDAREAQAAGAPSAAGASPWPVAGKAARNDAP